MKTRGIILSITFILGATILGCAVGQSPSTK